jgi:hypothetical protein
VLLYKDEIEITAVARINSSPESTPIISLGLANGIIKDFDMKSQLIIRESHLHDNQKVMSMISQGNYLISCSPENGFVIVYDFKNQQMHR